MTCESCGVVLEIGMWPWCPHGRGCYGVTPDAIDEWQEHLAPEPVHFTSRTQKRKYLKDHGLIEMVRHVGTPESDKSPRTTRWI